MQADIEAHYRWIEGVADRALGRDVWTSWRRWATRAARATCSMYELAQNRYLSDQRRSRPHAQGLGSAVFAAIMATLFVIIFWLASPLMDGIAIGCATSRPGRLVAVSARRTDSRSLVTDGIFAGVGAVVVFVPQIAHAVPVPGDPGRHRLSRAGGVSDGPHCSPRSACTARASSRCLAASRAPSPASWRPARSKTAKTAWRRSSSRRS